MTKTKKKTNYKNTNNKTKISAYLPENYRSRISRDIFVFTKSENGYEFLVKSWPKSNHRSKALYGNAFGTFLCRPPKNKEDLSQQIKPPINAKIILVKESPRPNNKYLLTYNLKKEILGFKTEQLKSVLGDNFSNIKKTQVKCYKLSSSKNNKFSMINAGMTVIASFIEIEKKEYDNILWINSKTACNPKINVHACIISHFMNDLDEKTNKKLLEYCPELKYINNHKIPKGNNEKILKGNNQKILKGNNIRKIYNLVNNLI